MTYDMDTVCRGASGRKLRQVCVWCDKYRKYLEEEEHETVRVRAAGRGDADAGLHA